MMSSSQFPDRILISVILALIILGILIISSVSAPLSQERFGKPFYYLNRQILFGFLPGLILAIFVFKIPLDFLKKASLILFLINLILLALVLLPKIGLSLGGATRWISMGPISFQPSEFLKLTFPIYLASWLSSQKRGSSFKKERGGQNLILVAFLLMIIFLSLFLIFQPNISTLAIIILIALLIYFLADTPFWHSFFLILIVFVSILILIKIAPYRANRLMVFLNPEVDPMGIGYQMKQSLIAIGSGGSSGLGLGMSKQKFGFLPQPISDSIFAIFAEETGFIGSLILISLFLVLFWRGFKVAKSTEDKFSKLIALGITFWLSIQAFINIGAMIGILPLTGIPLPFISYGGSHLITELIGVGILLNVSKNT